MMMMMMTTMIPFLVVLFALLGLADTPSRKTALPEELARRFDHLLGRLDTIADNVHPPLPTPLMAAAVFFVFCTSIPSRLAAAWGRLVRRATAAAPESRWAWLAKALLWVDWLLSPFKLVDWETRFKEAEAGRGETNFELEATKAKLDEAKFELQETRTALDNANTKLEETRAEKRRVEEKYLETLAAHGRTLRIWTQSVNSRIGTSQNP